MYFKHKQFVVGIGYGHYRSKPKTRVCADIRQQLIIRHLNFLVSLLCRTKCHLYMAVLCFVDINIRRTCPMTCLSNIVDQE